MSIELISFKVCPFVQRAVILLEAKGAEYTVKYIDLKNKPDWFLKISPFGKVPVLRTQDTTIFESMVIVEYLDEAYPPQLHPTNLITKALNRAWIEFGSNIFMRFYQMTMAESEALYEAKLTALHEDLQKLENILQGTPFFNGDTFAVIDASYAPFFIRFRAHYQLVNIDLLKDYPKLTTWSNAVLAEAAVKAAEVENFNQIYLDYCKDKGSFIYSA